MKRIMLVLPVFMILITGAAFTITQASSPVKSDNGVVTLVDTYFVFTGTDASQYTDSTKWTRHMSNPSPSCPGDAIACLVKSATLTTRSQLVQSIQDNGGEITDEASIEDKKAAL